MADQAASTREGEEATPVRVQQRPEAMSDKPRMMGFEAVELAR